MEDQIILQHDQRSISKLPGINGPVSGFDLRVMNRYLTLIRKRINPTQAEEIIAQEFNLKPDQITTILRRQDNESYVAQSVTKLTPTKENLMHAAISSLQDIVTFNIADCYRPGTALLKPLSEMPLEAQMAIKSYGHNYDGAFHCTFYSRLDAIKLLAMMNKQELLDPPKNLNTDDTDRSVGMFDHMLKAESPDEELEYPTFDPDDTSPPKKEEWS